MRHKHLAFAAVLATFGASAAQAVPVQWTTGPGANNHWYELIGTATSWTAASASATSMSHMGSSGYLATVTSAAEQTFLSTFVNRGARGAWLGGTDAATEGAWTWVTGEPWAYSNWAPGEPNNAGNEDYLVGWWLSDGRWNDLPNSSTNAYIVEYDGMAPIPLPAGLPLLLGALGLLGLASRRKSS